MKQYLLLLIIYFLPGFLAAQTVTGKAVNINGEAMPQLVLKLYSGSSVFTTTSASDGAFTFSNITGVQKDDPFLPKGFSVSNNYPNPFNPKTRINITLPYTSNVKVELFNVLGQELDRSFERAFNPGTNFVDLELNGLPNGIYIARINIDNKFTVKRKLLLLYGSQHLSAIAAGLDLANLSDGTNHSLQKVSSDINLASSIKLDSLVISGYEINTNSYYDLPSVSGSSLDLGNVMINIETKGIPCPGTPVITYAGKAYNTVQVGSQCWLRENLDVGTMVNASLDQTNNDVIEKYCYDNNPLSCTTYGGLYQWAEALKYKVSDGRVQGICPDGWHIPSISEFETLVRSSYVNNDGNKLKREDQGREGGKGPNASGFSALLAGDRFANGQFYSTGGTSGFWTSSDLNAMNAQNMYLGVYYNVINLTADDKSYGFSIRCIKDNAAVNAGNAYLIKDDVCADPSGGDLLHKRIEKSGSLALNSIAPDIILPDSSGKEIDLAKISAKKILVVFYSSWCEHCKKLIPDLSSLYKKYKTVGLEVLAVSLDDNKTEWQDFIKKNDLTWINVSDLKGWTGKAASDYFIYAT
ncbi:MAG: FISUMP domain-containing protein, partial [Clostridiales bacterium]